MSTPESLAHDAEHERIVEAFEATNWHDPLCPHADPETPAALHRWPCICDLIDQAEQRGRDARSAEWQDVLASANRRAAQEAVDAAVQRVEALIGEERSFGTVSLDREAVTAAITGETPAAPRPATTPVCSACRWPAAPDLRHHIDGTPLCGVTP
jgi:hypothetical protein